MQIDLRFLYEPTCTLVEACEPSIKTRGQSQDPSEKRVYHNTVPSTEQTLSVIIHQLPSTIPPSRPKLSFRYSLLLLLESPTPCLIQPQRIIPCLFLPGNLLRLVITILVLATQHLHLLVVVAHQGAQSSACGTADGLSEGFGYIAEGDTDGFEASVEDFTWGVLECASAGKGR